MRWQQVRTEKMKVSDLLPGLGISSPAVDVHAVASALGVQVIEDDELPCAGELLVQGETPIIRVRGRDFRTRKRFTIAHELGHLFLHPLESPMYRDTTFSGSPEEIEANRYAADLLMPDWMLDAYLLKPFFSPAKLAGLFDVSEQAMDIRLQMMAGLIR